MYPSNIPTITIISPDVPLTNTSPFDLVYPYRQPSSTPTRPSGQPSRQPSQQPTSQPSRQPSSRPTHLPSGNSLFLFLLCIIYCLFLFYIVNGDLFLQHSLSKVNLTSHHSISIRHTIICFLFFQMFINLCKHLIIPHISLFVFFFLFQFNHPNNLLDNLQINLQNNLLVNPVNNHLRNQQHR